MKITAFVAIFAIASAVKVQKNVVEMPEDLSLAELRSDSDTTRRSIIDSKLKDLEKRRSIIDSKIEELEDRRSIIDSKIARRSIIDSKTARRSIIDSKSGRRSIIDSKTKNN